MSEVLHPEPQAGLTQSRWSVAVGGPGEERREALQDLASSYWYCVYAWWRRTGLEQEPAATATQACFTRWLGASPPDSLDTGNAGMRQWLPARLAELAEQGVEPEEPAALTINLDWGERRYADEPTGEPEAIFQRRWALTLIEFTAATLRLEYNARGEEKLFAELLSFAGFEPDTETHYAAAAARLGRTVGAMRKAVFDFRTRQREVLRALAADTLLDPAEVDSEITALLCACDAPGPEAAGAPLPTAVQGLHPDEVLARAMKSVHMTGESLGAWQPPTVEDAARLFPQYEVSALLGRGGMGAVYQGRQTELDRLVAIKLLPLEVSVDRDFADRFRREARAMARLQHPNIIDVHDFGTTAEGHFYFVMEYVDGANLDAMIRGPGLEPAQALEIIGSVCDALAYAHAEGVVHRDIKPANVMVSTKGKVKVADFGLARLTDSGPEQLGHTVTGTVMGTPDYMAPEQKRGMNVDHRADIYSLGVMLYEMLCREVPQGIFDPPSHRVAVDSRVDQVVIKAMQQQPDRRYQSTQEMKADVDAAVAPQPPSKALALARLPLGGMSRAMTMFSSEFAPGAGSASRSKKKPLFAGLAALAVAGGLFYVQPWKKSAPPSPSPASDVAAPAVASGSSAAISQVAPFGPWQPLFTDAEWKQTVPGKREVVDGRVHLTGPSWLNPQPAADGAIQARIQFQQGSKRVGFLARMATDGACYKAELNSEQSVALSHFPPGSTSPDATLGKWTLPKPLQPGDTVLLELRLQGDRLTVLVDGAAAIDARDARLSGPGKWGIIANDGWFEAVKVQTPLPAAAPVVNPFGPWQPLFTDAEWNAPNSKNREVVAGRVHLLENQNMSKSQPATDGAIRVRTQLPEGSTKYVAVTARSMSGKGQYKLQIQGGVVLLHFYPAGGSRIELGRKPLAQSLQPGAMLLLELRLQGDRLTALVDGKVVIEAQDSHIPGPGTWGLMANDGWFESAEVQTPLPAAAPVVSAFGPWQPLFTEAEWKESRSRKQIVDGRVHLESQFMLKPQPAADGAIRARISIAEAWPKYAAIIARNAKGMGQYKLQVQGTVQAGGTAVALMYFTSDLKGIELERKYLSKSPPPGGLVLELRLLGNRLSALVDDTLLFEVRDSRLSEPGEWGLMASDGWFESVEVAVPGTEVAEGTRGGRLTGEPKGPLGDSGRAEVQTPLPAASDGWEDPFAKLTPEIVAQTGHGWSLKDGELFSPDTKPRATLPLPGQLSGISYRVRVKLRQLPSKDVFHIVLPVADRMCGFELEGWGGKYSGLGIVNGMETKHMPGVVVGKQVKDSAPHDLEVTVRLDGANATITTTLDTRPLYAWTGPTAALSQDPYWATTAPGALALGTYVGGWAVSAVKVKRLGPGDATKDAPFVNSLGMKFVPVPIVGGPTAGKTVLFSVWDTRVQDYEAFATETKREWQKPSFGQGPTHPAVLITWDDATAFCAWLTERERKSGRISPQAVYRLPSDHEWSCAAGIGDQEDATKLPSEKNGKLPGVYPWGRAWPPPKGAGNYAGLKSRGTAFIADFDDGFAATSPVGSFAANQFGLYDMSGNVWQWCEDWYDASRQSHVVRGGSWNNEDPDKLLTSTRAPYTKAGTAHSIRPVLVLPAESARAITPSAATTVAPAADKDGWEDLLAPLTPELLAQTGDGWRLQDGALYSPAKKFGLLPLTERYAGTSYQLRVKLRQLKPTEGFAIVLPVADRMVGFALDGWPLTGFYTSLNLVNGQFGAGLPGSIKGQQINDTEPHELKVTVRLDGENLNFTSTLDGRPLYSWLGPISALSQSDSWKKTPPGTLAFGTMTDIWAISEVKAKRLEK